MLFASPTGRTAKASLTWPESTAWTTSSSDESWTSWALYTEDRTLDKTLYLGHHCREGLLLQYEKTEQEDTLSTYCGFICFLEADLEFSPITASSKAISGSQFRKTVKKAPIQMMARDGRHGHLYCAARSHRFGTGSRIWQG
ncbi:hypothetical protein PG985_012222 [Apiospora marii]|uniref:uncharacterized protein n=1 Tax=Apiospora marii TaxID=335849 RepID=UPI00312CE8C7